MSFPEGFTWGVASASYQVEGTPTAAGGGPSVWDAFCARPGAIWGGNTGEVACDSYRRYREDVALMHHMGVHAYRFSISWPRVIPAGIGGANELGLGFYDRLVDEMLGACIDPYVTLFHWDYPQALYHRGGWLNPDSSDWFAEYAALIVDRLSDRVRNWMTLNEPQCFIGLGHQTGIHAPGDHLDEPLILRAAHNALLAHGKSAQVIRANARLRPRIGYAPVGIVKYPATSDKHDIDAARTAMFAVKDHSCWNNTWFMDPVFRGHYPEDGLALFGKSVPEVRPGDMETICQPMDFFGANIYNGAPVRCGDGGEPEELPHGMGVGRTAYGWPVTPEALYWGPRFFFERYGKPIIITENGCAVTDWPAEDGKVHDPQRIDFLSRHLKQFERAIDDGVAAEGYFQWCLADNFEWNEGYRHRFGLIYVDHVTQQRIAKDSAHWYARVIETNGACLHF